MQVVDLSDADRGYLEHVTDDCRLVLGVGVEIERVELLSNDEVRLRVTYRLGSAEGSSEGRGINVVAAHANLRQSLIADRIGLGLRALSG